MSQKSIHRATRTLESIHRPRIAVSCRGTGFVWQILSGDSVIATGRSLKKTNAKKDARGALDSILVQMLPSGQ